MEQPTIQLTIDEAQALLEIAQRSPKSLAEALYINSLIARIRAQVPPAGADNDK